VRTCRVHAHCVLCAAVRPLHTHTARAHIAHTHTRACTHTHTHAHTHCSKQDLVEGSHAQTHPHAHTRTHTHTHTHTQDLVEAGTTGAGSPHDPNLLYEIDKLSMERVSVFPDGDINIQAVATAPHTAAFARPLSQAYAMRSSVAPPHPHSVPAGLMHLGGGGAPSPAGHPNQRNGTGTGTGANTGTSGSGNGPRVSGSTLQMLNHLQSLTPAELDRVEERMRAEALARAGGRAPGPSGLPPGARGQAGMTSSHR
jgi:hypothetical protein